MCSNSQPCRGVNLPRSAARKAQQQQQALVLHKGQQNVVTTAGGVQQEYVPSAQLARRMASKWPRPDWHAPWKMYRVISGHLGCATEDSCKPFHEVWLAATARATAATPECPY